MLFVHLLILFLHPLHVQLKLVDCLFCLLLFLESKKLDLGVDDSFMILDIDKVEVEICLELRVFF